MEHKLKKRGVTYSKMNGFKWENCTFEDALNRAKELRKIPNKLDAIWDNYYREKGLTSKKGRG
jgi:hypothetical protein